MRHSLLTWLYVRRSSSWVIRRCSHDFAWATHHHETLTAHMTLREALITMSHSSLLTWLCVRRSSSWVTHRCSHDFAWGTHHHESLIVAHMTLREALIMSHSSLLSWLCVRRSSPWVTHRCSHYFAWGPRHHESLIVAHMAFCETLIIAHMTYELVMREHSSFFAGHWVMPATASFLVFQLFSRKATLNVSLRKLKCIGHSL